MEEIIGRAEFQDGGHRRKLKLPTGRFEVNNIDAKNRETHIRGGDFVPQLSNEVGVGCSRQD